MAQSNSLVSVVALALPLCAVTVSHAETVYFAPPLFLFPNHGVITVEAADMDNDGDADIVVASIGTTISLMRNAGDGTFEPAEPHAVGSTHLDIAVADFNDDGFLDVAAANFGSGSVSVLLSVGNGFFAPALDCPAPGTAFTRGMAAGDLDSDGDVDLIVGDAVQSNKVVLLNDGKGAFGATSSFRAGASTIAMALGDLDDDGDLDAISTFSGAFLHLNNGDGTFAPAITLDASGGGTALVIADLNADRALDIAMSRSTPSVQQAVVFLNAGAASAWSQTGFEIETLARDIAVGDLDNDGDLDLVTAHVSPVNLVNVLLNAGDGSFGAAQEFFPGIYPQSVAIADFKGDGLRDLVTANQFANPPSVGLLVNQTLLLLAADLTGDGIVDGADLGMLLAAWGPCTPKQECDADFDASGFVDGADLGVLLAAWTP